MTETQILGLQDREIAIIVEGVVDFALGRSIHPVFHSVPVTEHTEGIEDRETEIDHSFQNCEVCVVGN